MRLPVDSELSPAEMSRVLTSLRIFLDRCPECGGEIGVDQEAIESCCRSYEVLASKCRDCDTRMFEMDGRTRWPLTRFLPKTCRRVACRSSWVPESQQEQRGKDYSGNADLGGKAEAAIPFIEWLGKLGIEGNLSGNITGQRMTETADRVIDQGLHTQLRDKLDNERMIKPVTSDLESGDIVEVTGAGVIDPLYRLILALQRLIAVDNLEEISGRLKDLQPKSNSENGPPDGFRPGMEDQLDMGGMGGGLPDAGNEDWFEQMMGLGLGSEDGLFQSRSDMIGKELQQALDVIYGDDISLMMDVKSDKNEGADGTYPQCGMLLSENNLQVKPRELLSKKRYTVLGRVVETHQDGDWNYAKLLRVAESVFEDSEVNELRVGFSDDHSIVITSMPHHRIVVCDGASGSVLFVCEGFPDNGTVGFPDGQNRTAIEVLYRHSYCVEEPLASDFPKTYSFVGRVLQSVECIQRAIADHVARSERTPRHPVTGNGMVLGGLSAADDCLLTRREILDGSYLGMELCTAIEGFF